MTGHRSINPYSESQFRTLKHRPDFPARFGSFEDAHGFCGDFFGWYNNEHRHSGIAFHTPADVHYGCADTIRAHRAELLDAAYAAHPERFVRHPPTPPALPKAAWINKPEHAPGIPYVMRPLRYSINVTLDGCCDHRAMFADEDLHRHAVENLDRADALLLAMAG